MTMTEFPMSQNEWALAGDREAYEADRAAMAEREMMDEYQNRYAPAATMGEAHAEWHRNTGVPMGQPGCPMDACHPVDDGYQYEEPEPEAKPTVKCGNKKAHGGETGYHHTAAGVKECYASTGRFSGQPPAPRQPVTPPPAPMPVVEVEDFVSKIRAAEAAKQEAERQAARARYAAWRSIPVYVGGRGYYALEMSGTVHFFKVSRPSEGKHAGKTFVEEQAGDAFHKMAWVRTGEVLDAIALDPETAGRLYGQKIQKCYRCHRTLTDLDSRTAGIGPDCAKKG